MKTLKSILTAICIVSLSACSSITPAQQTQINSLASTIAPIVASYAATGNVNYAQVIPVALNSIAVLDPNATVNIPQLSTSITAAVSSFTNGTGGSTGQKIATAVLAALPASPTGAQANAALTAASVGASAGANP